MEEPDMANERKPNTPYEPEYLHDPIEPSLAESETRSPVDLDRDLRHYPELSERRANNTRIALLMLAIAIVLGAVFYGMNNSTLNQQTSTVPANSQPTTTGQAPANPQTPSPASTAPGGANTNTAAPSNAPASK
jgi:uncharacterized protein HemX